MKHASWIRAVALATVTALSPVSALAQSSPVKLDAVAPKAANLDFEEGEPGTPPPGWAATTASVGYPAETSAETPKSGARCGVVRGGGPAATFGILMQAIDATPYRGHRVRLRAALRADGARAMLWLRVDRAGKRMGFFDNMGDRPVLVPDWQSVEIVGDVDDDAEALSFGLLMTGGGSAFVDAVALDDLGKPVVTVEPPRPLAGRGLENLEAFTRLLGYVRHFHPSDEAAATDWNAFAVEGVRKIEGAASPEVLARALQALFAPVAPTVRVATSRAALASPALAPPARDATIVRWRHRGFGDGQIRQSGIYVSERIREPVAGATIPSGFRGPNRPYVAELPGGVVCAVPLALYADAAGTLPAGAARRAAATAPALVRFVGEDRATRLADVALAWNVLAHFYPYFDEVKTDWPAALDEALASAATDPTAEAFTRTLRRMVAALHDGHGGVQGPAPSRVAALPIAWDWVEDRLVVTTVAPDGAGGLAPGDVVERIDGTPAAEAIAAVERLVSSATPQWARVRALRELRSGPEGSSVALEVRSVAGTRSTVTLARSAASAGLADPRPEKIAELRPGVFYVDVDRVTDADVDAALPKLAAARGIVFDLRGYPNHVSPAVLAHLTDAPMQSARWNVPVISDPDWRNAPVWNTDGRWAIEPAAPRLKAKIAFVTDGRAISAAESWMGIVEAYTLGAIVGAPTAGTNGNIDPFALPGGYTIYWTGMKVLKHDGSRHHGVGILPTIPVSRTIAGVAAHRDELLDRALEVVSDGSGPSVGQSRRR